MFALDNIKAKIPLNIGVVGAGIGGLSSAMACARAGMTVTIYEAACEIREIGAGMQLGPNMYRILRRWGVHDTVYLEAVTLRELSLRRYADDTELSRVSLNNAEKIYGASMVTAHRADVQKALKEGAEAMGVRIELGSRVEDIDFKNSRIKIERCSDWIQKDVIIAADGIKSIIRRKMLALHGEEDKVRDTGDAAWRILIPAEQIYKNNDADLIEMLDSQVGIRWIGPDGHVVSYPIRNKTFLNVVFLHPNKSDKQESWMRKTDKKDMLEFYKNWNPRIKNLLSYVPDGEILEWNLCDSDQLVTWIEGNVALMGDAAHPMLPYIAQGAAQAVEDSEVLAICLAMIDTKTQIDTALKVYEVVRKERAEIVQTAAVQLRRTLHLHDGQEQQDRDDLIRHGGKGGVNPDLWADESFEKWCWGMDAQRQVIDMWDTLVESVSNGQKLEPSFNTKEVAWLKHSSKWQLIQQYQSLTNNK